MLPNHKKIKPMRNIQDRSWDLLAEMWLHKEGELLAEQLDADQETGKVSDMDRFFAEYDAKHLQLIQKATQRQRTKQFLKRTLPRIAQIAAIWIAVIVIGGGIAIAASSTVRVYFMKLLIETTPEYTRLQLVEDNESYLDVPEEWQGEYYPSLIPEGLVLSDIFSVGTLDNSVVYSFPNSAMWQFEFSESEDVTINIDTEGAEISQVMVCGYEGTMVCKENRICIYWFDGTRLFMIDVRDHSAKEALSYANSVKKIK